MFNASHIPIEKLITIAEGWSLGKFGLLRADCFTHNGDYYDIAPERFSELHPDMPAAMVAMTNWMRAAAQMDVAKYQVKATLEYLRNDVVEIVDGFNATRSFLSIDKIIIYPAYPDQVSVSGLRAAINEYDVGGLCRKFVTETHTNTVMPERAALEKQYPGWETRWLAGQALGLEGASLGRIVFTKYPFPVEAVPLTGVQFD